MQFRSLFLGPCLAAVACSGRYEVGAENAVAGSVGTASSGSSASGGGGSARPSEGASLGGGSSSAGGPSAGGTGLVLNESCSFMSQATFQPPPPPYAPPSVVWGRISRFILDREWAPLGELPAETTPEWAGYIALQALAQTTARIGPTGPLRFLAGWLQLRPDDAAFEVNWPALLVSDVDAIELLLNTPLNGPQRVGIFSEPAFLVSHPSISTRGAAMSRALWNQEIPPPPTGFILPPPTPLPGQSRRESLDAAVSQASCHGCHELFDPPGYALEHFNELGQYREQDAGNPVDSSGELVVPLDGSTFYYTSMLDLAPQLANTCAATLGFVNANYDDAVVAAGLFESAYAIPEDYAVDRARVSGAFMLGERSYRALVKGIAQSEAFLR